MAKASERLRFSLALALLIAFGGCGTSANHLSPEHDGAMADSAWGSDDSSVAVDANTASSDAALGIDVPVAGPNAGPDAYAPMPAGCGFDKPAFCDTFETGPAAGGRSGELDATRWSVARGGNALSGFETVYGAAFFTRPARMPTCRAGVSDSVVLPDGDVVVCDPTATIHSRHLLTANASQNYGVHSYRIRQPFDFAGRTGTVKLDVDLTNVGLCGFPAVVISEDPTPAPSFGKWEHSSGPRNGIEIVFNETTCHGEPSSSPSLHLFHNYVETVARATDNDPTACAHTVPGALNHVEIVVTQSHIEVWASDASSDGVTFPHFHRIYGGDTMLPFTRGYVNLTNHNHATIKYWCSGAWITRWDNVGFDGPVVSNWREISVPESMTVMHGLDGCSLDGGCQWVGDVIPTQPSTACPPAAHCVYSGDGRNVGWVLPDAGKSPLRIDVPGVRLAGATRARLALVAWYLYQPTVNPSPLLLGLHYRLNGGAWHDRMISADEANPFGTPEGAGNLNQMIDLPLGELRDGTNTIEWTSLGVMGGYPTGIVNLDLVLTTGS